MINILFAFSGGIRRIYFHDIYPFLSPALRTVSGWLPLSLGDLLYLLTALAVVFFLAALIRSVISFKSRRRQAVLLLLHAAYFLMAVYLYFMIAWGFNYRGEKVRKSFEISMRRYSTGELTGLCNRLCDQVNQAQLSITRHAEDSTRINILPARLFKEAEENYRRSAAVFPSLDYTHPSVKPSMYGYLMNYIGVSGYYNPFTGEAQVNTTIPPFLLPFVACHEIAHQLGFAAEYDANFAGYVVAASSPDPRFRYSANFEMLLYGLGELRIRDSVAAKTIRDRLNPGVMKDYHALRDFYRSFNNPVDPFASRLYDQYLKANHQERGIHSYDEVVALLIDFYRIGK